MSDISDERLVAMIAKADEGNAQIANYPASYDGPKQFGLDVATGLRELQRRRAEEEDLRGKIVLLTIERDSARAANTLFGERAASENQARLDLFAAAALTGLLAGEPEDSERMWADTADMAWLQAKAMLAREPKA